MPQELAQSPRRHVAAMPQPSIELTTTAGGSAAPSGEQSAQDSSVSDEIEAPSLHRGTTAIIFVSITGVTGISSRLAGLVTVALPSIGRELELAPSLLLWQDISDLARDS
jgi:hypothetical protein